MENNCKRRVFVIGGGAGGLTAAIAAARAGADVTIWEKANRVGKKILKTGNGRCNLSNRNVGPWAYNHPEFVAPVLEEMPCETLLDFFSELGLWTVADSEGRIYPCSDTAASVLDVLRLGCAEAWAREVCSTEALALHPEKGGWRLELQNGANHHADRVIVATGGGTNLLKGLEQPMVPFSPVLCPLRTDIGPIRGLTGLRVKCRARLLRGKKTVADERGEILFRDYGVSGILALDLSRFAEKGQTLSLDLMPDMSEEALLGKLWSRMELGRAPEEFLTGIFHRRVAEALIRLAGGTDPEDLARVIKNLTLEVYGPGDTANAQVTRGGADVSAFDPRTLSSLRYPGLYAVGEALDIDGRCGGYNLHWAFASGLAAGRSAAE